MRIDAEPTYTSSEVAALFRVDTQTVGRWASAGKLRCFRTPGGHRRFPKADVDAFLVLLSGGEGQ